jgi:hypothetical protein
MGTVESLMGQENHLWLTHIKNSVMCQSNKKMDDAGLNDWLELQE